MSVIAVCSVSASPGVTTTVLALAAVWPHDRRLLVVEADGDGGVVAARTGIDVEPGLVTLGASGRHGLDVDEVDRHIQTLPPGEVDVLVGSADGAETVRTLEAIGGQLAAVLRRRDGHVLVDCGRARPGSAVWPLVVAADVVVLVARPRLDEVQLLPPRLDALDADCEGTIVVAAVGERPHSPGEVADALQVGVLEIADDARGAQALAGSGGTSVLRRCRLIRSARQAARDLDELSDSTAPASRQPQPDRAGLDLPATATRSRVEEPHI